MMKLQEIDHQDMQSLGLCGVPFQPEDERALKLMWTRGTMLAAARTALKGLYWAKAFTLMWIRVTILTARTAF